MPKTINIGLEDQPLRSEELEDILVGLEERIREGIEKRLRRRLDEFEIVITADLKNGGKRLDIVVDVKATGRVVAPLSYDEIIAESIDEAVEWLAERLRKRVLERESRETN